MTDAALPTAAAPLRKTVEARLKQRHAQEMRFRLYGRAAIVIALSFLAILVGRIVAQGWTTFIDYRLSVPVYVDPQRIHADDIGGSNFDLMIADQMLARLGTKDDEVGTKSSKIMQIVSNDLGFQLLKKVKADPTLIGKTVTVTGPVKADGALYFKGEIKRSTPEAERKVDNEQIAWLDQMKAKGLVTSGFNVGFLTRSDSTEPEQAGVLGAVVGSAMMLLVTAFLAVPIGVLAATYLEEFAPKNRWTDIVEVNINNLAAVPSIVYGLLGLAVFINWLNVPRSSPLVGGLVLALMALPTVIIATRSALKAVPPSIREAALGVGASRTQTVFHHVLPWPCPA
jgi:phosphate transport system permease protein